MIRVGASAEAAGESNPFVDASENTSMVRDRLLELIDYLGTGLFFEFGDPLLVDSDVVYGMFMMVKKFFTNSGLASSRR